MYSFPCQSPHDGRTFLTLNSSLNNKRLFCGPSGSVLPGVLFKPCLESRVGGGVVLNFPNSLSRSYVFLVNYVSLVLSHSDVGTPDLGKDLNTTIGGVPESFRELLQPTEVCTASYKGKSSEWKSQRETSKKVLLQLFLRTAQFLLRYNYAKELGCWLQCRWDWE